MKSALTFLLSLTLLTLHAQNFESKSLYYAASDYKLTEVQKKILDSVVVYYGNRRISINGHADYFGTEERDQLVSERRVNAVLKYLVDRGFPETEIMNASGSGQILLNKDNNEIHKENPLNRRVDILITKGPELVSKLKETVKPEPPKVFIKQEPENVTKIDYDKLITGDIIALKNINFIPGTDRLMPDAFDEVNNLFEVLLAHPTLKLSLEGHVCCAESPDGYYPGTISWELSENRARRVQNLLIEKGISVERLTYKGFGRTKPLFETEFTRDQQQANRRVEIRIIAK